MIEPGSTYVVMGLLNTESSPRSDNSSNMDGEAIVIRYKLRKKAFGIATLFGDYKIVPITGAPPR